MNYRVLLQRSAQKALESLAREARECLFSAIATLSVNPRPPGCKKLMQSDYWRIRVGDYRVVYEIDDSKQLVVILHVGHRRDIYR